MHAVHGGGAYQVDLPGCGEAGAPSQRVDLQEQGNAKGPLPQQGAVLQHHLPAAGAAAQVEPRRGVGPLKEGLAQRGQRAWTELGPGGLASETQVGGRVKVGCDLSVRGDLAVGGLFGAGR
jgi:hypothetical protein